MTPKSPRVEFRLFSFGNADASGMLCPEGTMVFQGLGFPRDLEHHTCIPIGPVGYSPRTEVTELDAQWYRQAEAITNEDVTQHHGAFPRVKDYLYHDLRSDPNRYLISDLRVDNRQVQAVAFVGKRLRFWRLGHSVELDLRQVSRDQRFTLTIEWSYQYIEARVTWLEGERLDQLSTGHGVQYAELNNYTPPRIGRTRQFKARSKFEATVMPAEVARAIWNQSQDAISDKDETGNPIIAATAPRKVYRDGNDFLETMLNVCYEIQGILKKSKPNAFWDGTKPKNEVDAGAGLRLLFEAICAYKNIRVYQEDPGKSGDIDFVFSGISENSDHLELVLELKNAHSDRLKKGLTRQLPQYMNERQSPYGVYGVLWYKGRFFEQPQYPNSDDCLRQLRQLKPGAVNDIVLFDVSFPTQASRL